MNDNLGKMLNKIKNATLVKHEVVLIPYTLNNYLILKVLHQEGFLYSVNIIVKNNLRTNNKYIKVYLKYDDITKKSFIKNICRLSKPSLRVYTNYKTIPQILNGLGIVILSTSKGVMTSKEAYKHRIGGELLFSIW